MKEITSKQMKIVDDIINLYYKNNDLLLCLTSSTDWTCIFLKLKSGKLT